MLSLSPIKSSAAASGYFEKDDYYVRDGEQPSNWYGKGASVLGLSGPVDRDVFKKALEGTLPNDKQLGRIGKTGKIEHKPGWDLTFSAPKSVSILAEVGGDDRLIKAHDAAVKSALDWLESRAAITRIKESDEQIRREKTENLTAALFRHDTSRAQDPQLHTHAVVLNATYRKDGEWRSLESREMFRLQKEAGVVYRAALAARARELGYSIERGKNYLFEAKEVPESVRDFFSKRSEALEKALAAQGKTRESSSAREKETIVLDTREAKQEVDREALQKSWEGEAKALGFDGQTVVAEAKGREIDVNQARISRLQDAESSVKRAIAVLSEREASFRKTDLQSEAMKRGFEKVDRADIEKAITRLEEREELLAREVADRADSRIMVEGYTTPEAVKIENDLTAFVNRGKGTLEQVTDEKGIDKVLKMAQAESAEKGHTWTKDQIDATRGLLTSQDKIVGIQGAAGTAKTTTVLKTFAKEAEEKGYSVWGMAPSAAAAQQLEDGGGIKSQTIHSFLFDLKKAEREAQLEHKEANYHQAKADFHGAKAAAG